MNLRQLPRLAIACLILPLFWGCQSIAYSRFRSAADTIGREYVFVEKVEDFGRTGAPTPRTCLKLTVAVYQDEVAYFGNMLDEHYSKFFKKKDLDEYWLLDAETTADGQLSLAEECVPRKATPQELALWEPLPMLPSTTGALAAVKEKMSPFGKMERAMLTANSPVPPLFVETRFTSRRHLARPLIVLGAGADAVATVGLIGAAGVYGAIYFPLVFMGIADPPWK